MSEAQAIPITEGKGTTLANFTPVEVANFLAAKAVACATAFLDGRDDETKLAGHATSLQGELTTTFTASPDLNVTAILDPTRMLVFAMRCTADAQGEARQDRWQHVMGAMVDLVRLESTALRESGSQRS